jgi:hypothetical protein
MLLSFCGGNKAYSVEQFFTGAFIIAMRTRDKSFKASAQKYAILHRRKGGY